MPSPARAVGAAAALIREVVPSRVPSSRLCPSSQAGGWGGPGPCSPAASLPALMASVSLLQLLLLLLFPHLWLRFSRWSRPAPLPPRPPSPRPWSQPGPSRCYRCPPRSLPRLLSSRLLLSQLQLRGPRRDLEPQGLQGQSPPAQCQLLWLLLLLPPPCAPRPLLPALDLLLLPAL